MSSVFSKPKVVQIEPEEVEPEVVDNSEEVQELERKRKKKMGAVSQLVVARQFLRPAARPRSALNRAGGGEGAVGSELCPGGSGGARWGGNGRRRY